MCEVQWRKIDEKISEDRRRVAAGWVPNGMHYIMKPNMCPELTANKLIEDREKKIYCLKTNRLRKKSFFKRKFHLAQKSAYFYNTYLLQCGCSSGVEHHVANVIVVSSNLITRFFLLYVTQFYIKNNSYTREVLRANHRYRNSRRKHHS